MYKCDSHSYLFKSLLDYIYMQGRIILNSESTKTRNFIIKFKPVSFTLAFDSDFTGEGTIIKDDRCVMNT